ncbi:hypothetical protein KAV47_05610 [Candidatus Bathyarchaeota archaeon]|nr:hypothetical protein [Candidatus Bathyarchaeota archaeon]
MSLMTTVKTTINIDEDVWEEFKRTVARRYGGTRNLSQVVEEALMNYNTLELLRASARELGVDLGRYPSSNEVEMNRPMVPGSSAEFVREMRDERADRVS